MKDQNHTKMPVGRDIPLLLLGILGIGMSGPLVAMTTIPVIALIFWRNIGGTILLLPFALRLREWQTSEQRSGIAWAALAGFLLSLHFIGFFYGMRYTSVATGTALVAMQPIFAAIITQFLGGHIPRPAWFGMTISFIGVVLITGIDLHLSVRSFVGDIAALISGALSAMYVIIGSQAQKKISTFTYTTICYFVAAITAIPMTFVMREQAFGYARREWLLLLALIVSAQILGHTMFNFALKRVAPTVVSLIVFFEVPVAAILAWWWIGQTPPNATIPGIILILLGCAVFVLRTQKTPQP